MSLSLRGILKETTVSNPISKRDYSKQEYPDSFNQILSRGREKTDKSRESNSYGKQDTKSGYSCRNGTNKIDAEQIKKLDKKAEDEIMNLLLQFFNMPQEEMQQHLKDLGLEVDDLMKEEEFSRFIGGTSLQEDANDMLSDKLEGISKLFEEIKNMKAEDEQILNNISSSSEEGISLQGVSFNLPGSHFTSAYTQDFRQENKVAAAMIMTAANDEQSLVEQIDYKVIDKMNEIIVRLKPKELGELSIKVTEVSGIVAAEIRVDNEKAEELVTNDIDLLKESLKQQGISISEVKVEIRQPKEQSQMQQERQKSSKRIQEIISKHLSDEGDEIEEVIAASGDSEVDYIV